MAFKIGDKVIIGELDGSMIYGCNEDMKELIGKIAIITKMKNDGSWAIDLDGGSWSWSDEMLILYDENVEKKKVPYVISKDKEDEDRINYYIMTKFGIFSYLFYKDEDSSWVLEVSGKANREILLLLESILRGLNSGS